MSGHALEPVAAPHNGPDNKDIPGEQGRVVNAQYPHFRLQVQARHLRISY